MVQRISHRSEVLCLGDVLMLQNEGFEMLASAYRAQVLVARCKPQGMESVCGEDLLIAIGLLWRISNCWSVEEKMSLVPIGRVA